MARKVFITNDMCNDERISEIAERSELFAMMWPWLITCFDDWGRAQASPRRIKTTVFPAFESVTSAIVEEALQTFSEQKMLYLYEVDGKPYMCIPEEKWYKYQTHMNRKNRRPGKDKMASDFPPNPQWGNTNPHGDTTGYDGEPRVPVPSPSPSPNKTHIYGESIQKTLKEYSVTCKGIYELERLTSYEGIVPIETMTEAIKRSEGKGVPYVLTVIESIKNELTKSTGGGNSIVGRTGQAARQKPIDPDIAYRRREIAFNQWIEAGNDPSEFIYRPN